VKPAGLSIPTTKYRDIDPVERARLRKEWNRPVLWPAVVLVVVGIMIILPGVRVLVRERR
jgi:hypothetical protein